MVYQLKPHRSCHSTQSLQDQDHRVTSLSQMEASGGLAQLGKCRLTHRFSLLQWRGLLFNRSFSSRRILSTQTTTWQLLLMH